MPAFITLSQSGWLGPIALGMLVVAVLLIWSYRAAWSEGSRFRAAAIAKFLALALLAICLTEPLWSSQRVRPGANLFLLVADNSQSLQLTDPQVSETRGQQLQRYLTFDEAPWHVRLEQDFEVRRYQFDAQPKYVADFAGLDFSGDRSEIRAVLQTLGERLKDRPVAGLLLFSDGIATDELSSIDWSGLPPIYPVPIGLDEGHCDLSIADVQTSTTAFEDAPVTMVVELATAGIPPGPITVRVEEQDGIVAKSEVQMLSGDGKSPVFRFQLRPIQSGVTFYRVRAGIGEGEAAFAQRDQAGEVTLANNDRWVTVDRGTGPYRLLYVSGRPNWELKFLRRAIEDDDQLQMTAIVRIAKKEAKFDFRGRDGESSNPLFRGFDRTGEETERYDQPVLVRLNTVTPDEFRDGFPKTAEELYQFHAVILDDIEAQFFTAEQLSLIERFVSERGGGCLMLGGQESFKQGGFEKTALARLLPAYLTAPPVLPPETGYRLSLTKEGWLQPWARLRSNEADEVRRLREMAGFRVINTVSGLKPGASVIAEVTDPQARQYPAVVEQRYGQGRAAALLIGDFWRWQLEVTDAQRAQDDLGKAWRQLLRWLIVDVPDRVELKSVADATSGVSLTRLEARVRDEEFHAQDNAAVTITVQPPAGPELTLQAEPSLREPGLYETTLASRPAGPWTAKVEVKDPDGQPLGSTTTGWSADLIARELRQVQPDRKFLKQLADSTGGQLVELADLERFVATLPNRQAPITETTTSPLWHHPAVLLLIMAGLCAEWGLRRRSGLP